MTVRTVRVELGDRSYAIAIGTRILGSVREFVPPGVSKVAILTQANIPHIPDMGELETRIFMVPEGEGAKSMAVAADLAEGIADFGLSRSDLVLAVGGGVVTDLAGFVASVYYRGIRYMNVATTLLAQVDAAIGGKTGVNLPAGKNLIGSFWQPSAVICDVATLATLSGRELRSGLGEMAKYEFLGSGRLEKDDLESAVARCAAIKAAFVSGDEREGGARAILNYGHTMGHALEALGLAGRGEHLYHGEAVAIGLIFAAHLAEVLGRIGPEDLGLHYDVVTRMGLPDRLPDGVDVEDTFPFLERDKKAMGSITFVLRSPGSEALEVVRGIERDDIRRAWAAMEAGQRS